MDQREVIDAFSEQIYYILKEDILSQRIRCGEVLAVKSLQQRFYVSATEIRDVLNRLNREGLTLQDANGDAKVILLFEKDICEIYVLCYFWEAQAFRLVLDRSCIEDFSASLALNVSMQEAAIHAENAEDYALHAEEFHDIIYRYADNERLCEVSRKARGKLYLLMKIHQDKLRTKESTLEEYKGISSAVAAGQLKLAEKLLERHFEFAKRHLMKELSTNHGDSVE